MAKKKASKKSAPAPKAAPAKTKTTKPAPAKTVEKKAAPKPEAKKTEAAPKRKFKVKRTVSGTQKVFRKWKDWEEGDYVIGKVIGRHEDNYDKMNTIVKVEDAVFGDDSGDNFIGKNLVLNSNGMLDKAMEEIEDGEIIQVEYRGTGTIESGKYKGKESHVVAVDVVVDENEDLGEEEEEEEETEDLEEEMDEELEEELEEEEEDEDESEEEDTEEDDDSDDDEDEDEDDGYF